MSAPFPPRERSRATLALIALRVVYAYNWLDIGPGLTSIGNTFHLSVASFGWLIASFFVGAGLMQIPAGLLARAWGTRFVTILGAAVLGVAALTSALAPDFYALVTLRFVAGLGAGLFFSPAIALVTELYPQGERGLPVGTFTSMFSLGAGLGVFLPALLLPEIGWRGSIALGGALVLAVLTVTLTQVPARAGAAQPGRRILPSSVPAPLKSLPVWAIGFAFIGLEGASLSASQYFFPYAVTRGWSLLLAGVVGALFVFPSLFGGPVGGWLTETFTNRRTQMVLFTAVPGLLFLAIPLVGLPVVAAIAIIFSFSYGMVYPMMYVIPPYLPGLSIEDLSLSIGLLNAIQLAGGALVSYFVAQIIESDGYASAWDLLGLTTAGMLVFMVLVPKTGKRHSMETAAMTPTGG